MSAAQARDTLRAPATAGEPLPPFAAPAVWACAALALALLLLTANRYGYHRDELYFLEASKHLAWGYVDQPPISVALVWLSHALFGNSLAGLRLFPALADAGAVLLTGLLARELGGGRFPQALAALSVAVGPFLIAGHLAGPTIYDLVAWVLVSLLVVRILRTGHDRLWLVVGLVVGVALENKETILFLVFGLLVGLLVNRRADLARSPWLWAGTALAMMLWSPNLVWQAQHGWPTFEMSRNLRQEHSGLGASLKYPFIQLLLPGIQVIAVWLAGLVAFLREPRLRPYRAFAVAYLLLLVIFGIFLGDRPYYVAGLYPVLVGAGAIVTEGVTAGRRRFFSERPPRRRLLWRSQRVAIGFVLVLGLLGLPISIPVLPARTLATVPLQNLNYNLGENVGWQDLVAEVAAVYRSLPATDRARATIVAENYGEAGALDRYGAAAGLPPAFSGHNNFWWWGSPTPATGITIAVGFDDATHFTPYFGSVRPAGRIRNAAGVENDEQGRTIWLCRDQRRPWPEIWRQFRHYG